MARLRGSLIEPEVLVNRHNSEANNPAVQEEFGLSPPSNTGDGAPQLSTLDRGALRNLFAQHEFGKLELFALRLLQRFVGSAMVWHALGLALSKQGKDGVPALRKAVLLCPGDVNILSSLGNALRAIGNPSEAAQCFRQCVAIAPDMARMHCNLAYALLDLDCAEEAEVSIRNALRLAPESANAHSCRGNVLRHQGRLADSISSYKEALRIDPAMAGAHSNLGVIYMEQRLLPKAEESFRRALKLAPSLAAAHRNLANLHMQRGALDQAKAGFQRTLAIEPDNSSVFSSLLFCLTSDERASPASVFAAHRDFGRRFEQSVSWSPWHNDRTPGRCLRVGVISGDMRNHAVAHFIEPLFEQLDKQRVELWIYANHMRDDVVSMRLRQHCRSWQNVFALQDGELEKCIRKDCIDILIDLSGHTAANRLSLFCRKPAPVQATYLGYPNTTGLDAMDYVICDPFNAPRGAFEHLYTEKFARIPSSTTFAPVKRAPDIGELPALRHGHLTFGSFNRLDKIGDGVILTWSRVLLSIKDSRLLVAHLSDPDMADQLRARFSQCGIDPERVEFHSMLPMHEYLALHNKVDIVLDTWPYTGGTTNHHALWMGVPVITLQGWTRAQCQSAASLARMGLTDWVTQTEDQFVKLAVYWSTHLPELAALRADMRARWDREPLRQPGFVARGFEVALRTMWQRWCAGLPPDHFEVPRATIE